MEGLAQRQRARARWPYQLSSITVASKPASPSAVASPAGWPLACSTRSASGRAAAGAAKPTPEPRGDGGARRPQCRPARPAQPGTRAASQATSRPTTPAPTTAMRSPSRGAASHSALTAVSMLAASTARAGGTPSGSSMHRLRRHHVARLVRVQAEHRAAEQRGRAPLDHADAGVAVLDRRRKVAVLERRAHALGTRWRAPRRETPASRCRG